MKRLLWLSGDRGKLSQKEYHQLIRELAAAISGEVVIFSKSTPEHEARFMIIGDEIAEKQLKTIQYLNNQQLKTEENGENTLNNQERT